MSAMEIALAVISLVAAYGGSYIGELLIERHGGRERAGVA
jgi:hypothetical protein